jgi:hypothetical protein
MEEDEMEEEVRIGMKWWVGRELRWGEGRELRGMSLERRPGPDFSSSTSESLSCAAMVELSEPKR